MRTINRTLPAINTADSPALRLTCRNSCYRTLQSQLASSAQKTYTNDAHHPWAAKEPVLRLVYRLCFVLLCSMAVLGATARADNPADGATSAALASARSGDLAKAYVLAGQSKDPLALKLVRWLDYSRGTADNTRFADIAAF